MTVGGEVLWLFGLNRNRRGKHGLAAFTLEYRVGVGDLRRVPHDIRCRAEGAELVTASTVAPAGR